VSEDAVKRAIQLHDLEGSYDEQPEEVVDGVERMLEMKGIHWPSLDY